jgi:hypothetical protein
MPGIVNVLLGYTMVVIGAYIALFKGIHPLNCLTNEELATEKMVPGSKKRARRCVVMFFVGLALIAFSCIFFM